MAPSRADLNSEAICKARHKSFSQREAPMSPPGRTGTVDDQAARGQYRNLTNGRFALHWTRSHEPGAPPTGDHANEQSDTLAAHAVHR